MRGDTALWDKWSALECETMHVYLLHGHSPQYDAAVNAADAARAEYNASIPPVVLPTRHVPPPTVPDDYIEYEPNRAPSMGEWCDNAANTTHDCLGRMPTGVPGWPG